MPLAVDPSRAVLRVTGEEAKGFLQGLLTNDVGRAGPDQAVYAALLTPQGKFLFDAMLVAPDAETYLLDTAADRAPAFLKRLSMYKLRAKVTVEAEPDLAVVLAWDEGAVPENAVAAFDDPRDPALGRRALAPAGAAPADAEALAAHLARRIDAAVPAAGAELIPEDTYPLEAGFERAQGVDFKKGCFVGQEIVARMKHKAELKKRLVRVRIDGPAPPIGAEATVDGKPAGVMGASAGDLGLAVLRVDRAAKGELRAGDARLIPLAEDMPAPG